MMAWFFAKRAETFLPPARQSLQVPNVSLAVGCRHHAVLGSGMELAEDGLPDPVVWSSASQMFSLVSGVRGGGPRPKGYRRKDRAFPGPFARLTVRNRAW